MHGCSGPQKPYKRKQIQPESNKGVQFNAIKYYQTKGEDTDLRDGNAKQNKQPHGRSKEHTSHITE
jgi:hypothetical protein